MRFPFRAWVSLILLVGLAASLPAEEVVTSSTGASPKLPLPLEALDVLGDDSLGAAKIALGRKLFFEPRLSRTERVSCATCHAPEKGFSNGERFAEGVEGRRGTRHVPGLMNVGYGTSFFWDGRSDSLESQALAVLRNPAEMDMPPDVAVRKLNGIAKYREAFQAAFEGPATPARIGEALAAFERTIVSRDTPFDRHLRGDRDALSGRAFRGMRLFYGRARCSVCHEGPRLTDDRFHNIGTAEPDDAGRRAVTGRAADQGAFRTPQLREVGRTAPYMHDGRFDTLTQVVEHYNFGGVTDAPNEHRDEALEVLYLGEDEVSDLVAFLSEGLTGMPADRASEEDEKLDALPRSSQ